jgi:hypothetical protein
MTKILTAILLATTLLACGGKAPEPAETADVATAPAADTTAAAAPSNGQVMSLTAKFVDFELGDASHYSFEDKTGKTWDFGRCEDKSLDFAKELPESEANETNQGWASNKDLQGKWFDLKYVVKQEEMYIDGPVGDVMVIVEAKQAAGN